MKNKKDYKLYLKCYNCGHQWLHMIERGQRLYASKEIDSRPVIFKDIGIAPKIEFLRKGQPVICPHCHTDSKIENITAGWAPPNGYGSNDTEIEEDHPDAIEKAEKEKEKAKEEVIKMEENKK